MKRQPYSSILTADAEAHLAALAGGEMAMYYAVKDEAERMVVIVAIGEKDRDRTKIGGKFIEP